MSWQAQNYGAVPAEAIFDKPILPMEQPTSPLTSTKLHLRRAKWVASLIAGVLLGLVAGRDVWLPRVISWALPHHLNATLDEVETSLFPPALLVRGFHLADTTSGWDVEVSYVEAAGIAWQAGRLHVASLQLDSVECAADVARGTETSGASPIDLGVDALRWNHLHVATAIDTVAWGHGMALGLKLSPRQRSVDRLSWDTCRWNAPALPQELVLGPSSLSIQDDVEGWQVSSDEVQLPGVLQRCLEVAPSRNPRPSPGQLESSPCMDVGARWLGKLRALLESTRFGTVLVDMVPDP